MTSKQWFIDAGRLVSSLVRPWMWATVWLATVVVGSMLAVTLISHAWVACDRWTYDGCYIQYHEGEYLVRDDDSGGDVSVSAGATPTEAWDNAPTHCQRHR